MLKNMYKWLNHFKKDKLLQRLEPYHNKLEIINNNDNFFQHFNKK